MSFDQRTGMSSAQGHLSQRLSSFFDQAWDKHTWLWIVLCASLVSSLIYVFFSQNTSWYSFQWQGLSSTLIATCILMGLINHLLRLYAQQPPTHRYAVWRCTQNQLDDKKPVDLAYRWQYLKGHPIWLNLPSKVNIAITLSLLSNLALYSWGYEHIPALNALIRGVWTTYTHTSPFNLLILLIGCALVFSCCYGLLQPISWLFHQPSSAYRFSMPILIYLRTFGKLLSVEESKHHKNDPNTYDSRIRSGRYPKIHDVLNQTACETIKDLNDIQGTQPYYTYKNNVCWIGEHTHQPLRFNEQTQKTETSPDTIEALLSMYRSR